MTKKPQRSFGPLIFLILLLLLKSGVMVWFINTHEIGLGPDEAQYWTWSQALDWGYYSKPPGIAWQIWLGTKLFGNTELGVRFMSVVFGFLLSLSVYFLALACQASQRTAFWAGVISAFIPLGWLSSFLAITDVGLALFWTLSATVIACSLAHKQPPNYFLLGVVIAVGALFKWPIYLFWPVVLIFWFKFPSLRSIYIIPGLIISLLGLIPSVIWNMQHEWATFRHVSATVSPSNPEGNVLSFLGMQIALLSPIFFGLLLAAAIYFFRQTLPPALFFCGASSLIILLSYTGLSLFQKIQGNWSAYVYPTAIVFISWYAIEKLRFGLLWIYLGLALSILLTVATFALPTIQARGLFPLPYRLNLFKHNVGWVQLENTLEKAGYNPEKDFLFSDKYQNSSILSFYGPQQKRAYFLNLNYTRKNQFSFWPGMAEEQNGQDGYFLVVENSPHLEKQLSQTTCYEKLLQPYFKKVTFLGAMPLFEQNGVMAKGALIYKCEGYNGEEPFIPPLY